MTLNDPLVLANRILSLGKSIRYCSIIDRLGYVVASLARKNLESLLTDADVQRQALQSAIRHFRRPPWENELGMVYYAVTRYEKVIGATIPMGKDHLMLVAFDADANNFDRIIMQKIMPLIGKF